MGAKPALTSVVQAEEEVPLRRLFAQSVAQSLAARYDVEATSSVEVGVGVARTLARTLTDDASVFMATAARLGPHAGHIGSIAEHVIRRAWRPSMLVGPSAASRYEHGADRLILPVDGSELSELAIEPATELARILSLPLWVVTVVTKRIRDAASMVGIDPAAESNYVRNIATDIAAQGVDAEFEVLHGDTAGASILDFAGRDGAVVMSTHGRSGLMRIALGSVTSHVVRHSPYPTVVVPPGDR